MGLFSSGPKWVPDQSKRRVDEALARQKREKEKREQEDAARRAAVARKNRADKSAKRR